MVTTIALKTRNILLSVTEVEIVGTVLREYWVTGGGTEWMGSSFFNLAPNARRTGLPYAPLELEFKYIKNGEYKTEKHVLPTGKGKIRIESSAGDETVWGEVKYRVKSLGGLPTGVREIINDGTTALTPR